MASSKTKDIQNRLQLEGIRGALAEDILISLIYYSKISENDKSAQKILGIFVKNAHELNDMVLQERISIALQSFSVDDILNNEEANREKIIGICRKYRIDEFMLPILNKLNLEKLIDFCAEYETEIFYDVLNSRSGEHERVIELEFICTCEKLNRLYEEFKSLIMYKTATDPMFIFSDEPEKIKKCIHALDAVRQRLKLVGIERKDDTADTDAYCNIWNELMQVKKTIYTYASFYEALA